MKKSKLLALLQEYRPNLLQYGVKSMFSVRASCSLWGVPDQGGICCMIVASEKEQEIGFIALIIVFHEIYSIN
ncbi:MAG: hypothetical protein F6K39_20905 [Okeania sp. SIO3B3]|nr:hypothetical protein [Okeania sp. SIO3B3]